MPALFGAPGGGAAEGDVPIAQLGSGPDGVAVLARRGDQLVEIVELAFGPESPRWAQLETRVRAIGQLDHAAIRPVLGLSAPPPELVLEGDNHPPLAELVEQPSVDLARALRLVLEVARAIAAAHRIGIVHGRLQPWAVHIGGNDRPRIELTGLATKPT
jgi:hypothetical protein